jgi:Flp pilus assembly protein TadB
MRKKGRRRKARKERSMVRNKILTTRDAEEQLQHAAIYLGERYLRYRDATFSIVFLRFLLVSALLIAVIILGNISGPLLFALLIALIYYLLLEIMQAYYQIKQGRAFRERSSSWRP